MMHLISFAVGLITGMIVTCLIQVKRKDKEE